MSENKWELTDEIARRMLHDMDLLARFNAAIIADLATPRVIDLRETAK